MSKLRPFFFTQLRASGAVNKACRVATICNCVMDATENEGALNAKGRHLGRGGRLALVKRGWRKFTTLGDDNGWMDQGDVIAVHRHMFPGLPDPIVTRERPADVWDAIGDYSVSIAIQPGAVGAGNPIRKWVGPVPHQGKAHRRMKVNGVKWVKWVCPMHPASEWFDGVWVKWADLVKCAMATDGAQGEMFVELFPKGDWTEAKRTAAVKQGTIRGLRAKIERKDDALTAQGNTILTLTDRNDRLSARIDALEARDCGDDKAARLAALEQAQEATHDAIEALKDDAA